MTIDPSNMKRLFSLLILIMAFWGVKAQELQVQVTINTPKLQTTAPEVFETLETAIEEFMNNQKWTSEVFEQEERIGLSLVLTISKELSTNTFEGELSLQSIRPVFGSTYNTPMFKHLDKDVVFTYEQFQPLEFSQTNYLNNLTSILGYYAYIVLGMDFDSFSPFGGEPYFQMAQDIVNRIPPNVAGSVPGWRSTEGNRNRYWLIENILSPRCRPFRQAIYDYHRQGLDIMHENPAAGRAVIAEALDALNDVNRSYPNSMILQVFANTKSDEIIEIFKAAPPQEKTKIVQTMSRIDPPRASNYRQQIGR
ncbi:MAG: DUF4835 family protein [Bacteroidetes bacterium]|nr:MAG: DUF4835 family protein [Bacteroidota bacterium]